MFGTLAIGVLFGFVGSMPVAGPVALLIVVRALSGRYRSARLVAVGNALVEGVWAGLACWGVGAALSAWPGVATVVDVVAAVILLALGGYFLTRGTLKAETHAPDDRGRDGFVLGVLITALNPTLAATWSTAVAAAVGAGLLAGGPADAAPFAVGTTAGILVWFLVLVTLIQRYGGQLSERWIDFLIRGTGGALVIFGLVLGYRAFA